ncbi:MAG: hypothetical protein ACI4Q3_09230 [Kiritimatiellia bacterium]
MKTIIGLVNVLIISVGLVALSGCSPSVEQAECSTDGRKGGERARLNGGLDISQDLDDFSQSFDCGDGTPSRRGKAILEKIVNFPDVIGRTNGLAQFRKAVFAIEFSGSNYIKLSNGLGSMESLQSPYLSAAYQCGCGLDEDMGYRIDFLKWLKREMARPMGVGTNYIERRLGPCVSRLSVSRETYQKALRDSYKLRLYWMEEAFNCGSTHPAYSNEIDAVQLQLEAFLGRPIRTNEELRRDRGAK